jgi:HlyD family secretion protein
MKKWIVIVLVAAGVALKFTVLKPNPLKLKMVRVKKGSVEATVTSSTAGTLKAVREVILCSEIPGRVVKIFHREGASVAAGQIIVQINRADYDAQLAVADANLKVAESELAQANIRLEKAKLDHSRTKGLFEKKAVSEFEMSTADYEVTSATENVETAKARIAQIGASRKVTESQAAKTEIKAPFAGVISRRFIEEGASVTIGTPLFELLDISLLQVVANIDEADLAQIKLEQVARLSFDSLPGQTFEGKVVFIAPVVLATQEKNRTAEVKVNLPNPEKLLLVGMSADVSVVTGFIKETLFVPTKCLKGDSVFAFSGGKISQKRVKLGLSNWDTTEVSSGLTEGELIVSLLDLEDKEEIAGREAEPGEIE